MDDTHKVLHVVFGPLEMGIPIRRRRALMAEKRSDQPAGDDRAEITTRTSKRRVVEQLKALVEVFLEKPKSLPEGLQDLSHGPVNHEFCHGLVVQVLVPGAAGNGAEEAEDAGKGAEEAEDDDEAGEADEEVQENATKAEEEHQQEQVSPMELFSQALAATTKVHGIGFPSHLRASSWVQDFVFRMLDAEDEATLNKNRLIWRRLEVAMAAMIKSLQGATSGLKKYLEKREAQKTKRDEQARATLDRERVQSQKQELGARARRLQQAAVSSLPPFYAQLAQSVKFTEMAVQVCAVGLPSNFDLDQPAVIQCAGLLWPWLTKPMMQQVLTGFGGKYKKMAGYAEDGKTSNTFVVKQGKEETSKARSGPMTDRFGGGKIRNVQKAVVCPSSDPNATSMP